MKKIVFVLFVVLLSRAYSYEKIIHKANEKDTTFYYFKDIKEFEKSLPKIVREENLDFYLPDDWVNPAYALDYRATKAKSLGPQSKFKADSIFSKLTPNSYLASFMTKTQTLEDGSIQKILAISLVFRVDNFYFQKVFPIYNDTDTERYLKILNDESSVQVPDKERIKTNNTVSFMTFIADTTNDDITKYLEKNGIKYTHSFNNSNEKFYISHILYKNVNYQDIFISYKNNYSIIEKITCTVLNKSDFETALKDIKNKYSYDEWNKVYHGKNRSYSNYYNYKINSSEGNYYDEISVDESTLTITYFFAEKR